MTDGELLAFHRDLIAIPSVSGGEGAAAAFVAEFLGERGVEARVVGQSVLATVGAGRRPVLALNSHLDTVPSSPAWTRDPWRPERIEGRVYGLGSNDAKASVAALVAAFLRAASRGGPAWGGGAQRPPGLVLMLAEAEETDGSGTKALIRAIEESEITLDAAVIGEPTGLDLCVAQMGRLVLALTERGEACHAAYRRVLGRENPLVALARDIVAVSGADLGPPDPFLGLSVIEPTLVRGGVAANVVPPDVSCVLDVRYGPGLTPDAILERLRQGVSGTLEHVEEPLPPCSIDPEHPLVRAARRARSGARCIGSAGLSDWTAFRMARPPTPAASPGIPSLKVGPGLSTRSHAADEYVLEEEVLEGARFYEALIREYARASDSTG